MNDSASMKKKDFAEDDIDLIEILADLWTGKLLIFLITLTAGLGSIYYSYSVQSIYTSSSLIKIVESGGQSGISGEDGGMGQFASLAGLNFSGGGDQKANLVLATLNSRDFLQHLLTIDSFLPNLIGISSYDVNNRSNIYKTELYDVDKNSWLNELPSFNEIHRVFLGSISTSRNNDGFITISVNHVSPISAFELLSTVIAEINAIIRLREQEESAKALIFLDEQLSNTYIADIRKSINLMIESQLKTQMLSNIREDYIIQKLDSPFIPEERSFPVRTRIVITYTLIAFLFSMAILFARIYLKELNFFQKLNSALKK